MTCELLEALETSIKRYRVTPEQAAELNVEAETVTVTWQKLTSRAASVLVTVPAGEDGWAMPTPHRPGWLLTLITKDAPAWWLK
ncbi:hypothetical protein DI272_19085 [Streptomyces sp. Act143]|uniref:hypothetical protein n=1 Tax=Streptomyces sp. Act143 TaxID=2200760 RepID=UPI000D6787FA|nr:hypothetical protein [Streptomyces sp. Act143]PWI16037.1 hypothetical protein DI272_19085 [Streptomyces sp. Act143]